MPPGSGDARRSGSAQLEERLDWPGLPLRKPRDLEPDAVQKLHFLQPPPERDKRKSLVRANLLGGAVLLLNRNAEGLRVVRPIGRHTFDMDFSLPVPADYGAEPA